MKVFEMRQTCLSAVQTFLIVLPVFANAQTPGAMTEAGLPKQRAFSNDLNGAMSSGQPNNSVGPTVIMRASTVAVDKIKNPQLGEIEKLASSGQHDQKAMQTVTLGAPTEVNAPSVGSTQLLNRREAVRDATRSSNPSMKPDALIKRQSGDYVEELYDRDSPKSQEVKKVELESVANEMNIEFTRSKINEQTNITK